MTDQELLAQLKVALFSGEKIVHNGDTTVTYQDTNELIRAISLLEAQMNKPIKLTMTARWK